MSLALSVLLAAFLITYSNSVIYKVLKLQKSIKNIREYFKYDEGSLFFINLIMVLISTFLIIISESIK